MHTDDENLLLVDEKSCDQSKKRKLQRDDDGKEENNHHCAIAPGKNTRKRKKKASVSKKSKIEGTVIDKLAILDTDIVLSNILDGGEAKFLRGKIPITNATARMFNSIIKPAVDDLLINSNGKNQKQLVSKCVDRVRKHRGRVLKAVQRGPGLRVANNGDISRCIGFYLPKPGSKNFMALVQKISSDNGEGEMSKSWLDSAEQLKKHKQEYGQVQQEDITDGKLRSWLKSQIRNYALMVNGKHTNMNHSKMKYLREIGIDLDQGSDWDQLYMKLKTFHEKFGHFELDKEIEGSEELREFALSQQQFLKKYNPDCARTLDKLRYDKLMRIDFLKHHTSRNRARSRKQKARDKKEQCVFMPTFRNPESAISKGWALMAGMMREQKSLRYRCADQVKDMIRIL